MSALLTEHESHQPAHEIEDARDQILREAEDGLDGGEDAADDAGEDFEEGGDEVGDACRDGGHGCVVRWGCHGMDGGGGVVLVQMVGLRGGRMERRRLQVG